MSYETVLYGVRDGIATITLNRPDKLNAWTTRLGAELGDAMATADEDDDVRAVVVTGAGRAFCAGADLSGGEFGGGAAPTLRDCWPYQVRKPVIAAINGHAVGVGLTYPMTCDVRYVAEDAKLAFAFVRRGAIPELASHAIVPRVAMDKSVFEVSALENRLFSAVTSLPDAREGIAAFVEKRRPAWTGKVSDDAPG